MLWCFLFNFSLPRYAFGPLRCNESLLAYLFAESELLIDKDSVTYKNHRLVISRPSKPEPVEEVEKSMQGPLSHENVTVTPGEDATGDEHSICASSSVRVGSIPEDIAEVTLRMIFESKCLGGGVDVTNIAYEKGRESAVIRLSDPAGQICCAFIHSFSLAYLVTNSIVHSPLLIHSLPLIHSCIQVNCTASRHE